MKLDSVDYEKRFKDEVIIAAINALLSNPEIKIDGSAPTIAGYAVRIANEVMKYR